MAIWKKGWVVHTNIIFVLGIFLNVVWLSCCFLTLGKNFFVIIMKEECKMSHSISAACQQHDIYIWVKQISAGKLIWFPDFFVKDALVLRCSHLLRKCLRRFTVISSLMWYSKVHHALFSYLKRCIYLSCCQHCAQAFHMYIIESVVRGREQLK